MSRNDELFNLREVLAQTKASKDSADLNLANAKKKLDEWKEILFETESKLSRMRYAKWIQDNDFSNGTIIVLTCVITFAVVGLPIWFFIKSVTFASVVCAFILLLRINKLFLIRRPEYSNPDKSMPELDAKVVDITRRISDRELEIKELDDVAETCRLNHAEIERKIHVIVTSEEHKEKERIEREHQQKQRKIDDLRNAKWRELRGVPWEDFLQSALETHGFDVETTPASGDHGIDLIARHGTKSIAIQAKGYLNSVGNAAVQQAFTGMAIYRCTHCAVISNSEFTQSAKHAADKTGCILIGGSEIVDFSNGELDSFFSHFREE